jgi:hypothetical protein
VSEPNIFSAAWRCAAHGEVPPLHTVAPATAHVVQSPPTPSHVPWWLPWPLPTGWLVSGVAWAGDERDGARATAVALSGPSLAGGPADLMLVAEEPGVGLASGFAGLATTDPGSTLLAGPATARVTAAGHPTPLWAVADPSDDDVAVYVGEAAGCWLWALAWPSEASLELHDGVELVDLRDVAAHVDPPLGAASPRLTS